MRRIAITSSLVLVLFGGGVPEQKEPDRFTKVAGRLVEAINAADHDAIRQDFAKIMSDALPPGESRAFFTGLGVQYGKIRKLDPPKVIGPGMAVLLAHCERGKLDIKIVLDGADKIIGLWFLPHTGDIKVPDRNAAPLRLPFDGRWEVIWGGDTRALNRHHDVPNQRFAFDFVAVGDDGKAHRGKGTANEDYYAFGKEILAPGDGVVTDVIDGVRDNAPGSMNPYSALGNAVLIRHSEHEVSVLAHLKLGSIEVKVGDKVERGQVIGLCGNSGNSSQPHLHYHLQNTPVMQDATGIKCFFESVSLHSKDGEERPKQYSPVKGDIVAPG